MLPANQQIVMPKKYDQLFGEQALIAEFVNKAEEDEYIRRDSVLIHLIRIEVAKIFGSDSGKQLIVGDDWWPNHTRYVDLAVSYCIPAFLIALHTLLNDDFRDYRIQLCVYADVMDGTSYIGSLTLHTDRVLIEQKLHDHLHEKYGI